MKKNMWMVTAASVFLLSGLALMTSCSSSSSSPTGPSGIGQGKALYRGQVIDSATNLPVEGAEINVNGAPALDGGGNPIVSGADGYFEVTLLPGDAYTVEAWAEEPCVPEPCVPEPCVPEGCIPEPCVPEPCVPGPPVLIWSDSVVVTPGNEIDPVEPEVVSNGIGECVSECVHLYKPGSGVPPEDLITLGATRNGKFNATPCVQFCKENFRGVALPGDSNCNPFYLTYPVCNGEPADASGVDGPKPKKPKKPKSNNGNGNANPNAGFQPGL
ncbi:hypothetical protein ACFL2P_02825 [Candidatus Moduliflexota bacterium]